MEKMEFKRSMDESMMEVDQPTIDAKLKAARDLFIGRNRWVTRTTNEANLVLAHVQRLLEAKEKKEYEVDDTLIFTEALRLKTLLYNAQSRYTNLKEVTEELEFWTDKANVAADDDYGPNGIESKISTQQQNIDKLEKDVMNAFMEIPGVYPEVKKEARAADNAAAPDTQGLATAFQEIMDIRGGTNPRTFICKPNMELKPAKELVESMTTKELEEWVEEFQNFFNGSNMKDCSPQEQRHYLKKCVSESIWMHISALDNDKNIKIDPNDTQAGVFKELLDQLAFKDPTWDRRMAFIRITQQLLSDNSWESWTSLKARLFVGWRTANCQQLGDARKEAAGTGWFLCHARGAIRDPEMIKLIIPIDHKDFTWDKFNAVLTSHEQFNISLRRSEEIKPNSQAPVNQVTDEALQVQGNRQKTGTCELCNHQLPPSYTIRRFRRCIACERDVRNSASVDKSKLIRHFKCSKCRSSGNHKTEACKGSMVEIPWQGSDRNRSRDRTSRSRDGRSRSHTPHNRRDSSRSRDRSGRSPARGRGRRSPSPYSRQSYTRSGFTNMIDQQYEYTSDEEQVQSSNLNMLDIIDTRYGSAEYSNSFIINSYSYSDPNNDDLEVRNRKKYRSIQCSDLWRRILTVHFLLLSAFRQTWEVSYECGWHAWKAFRWMTRFATGYAQNQLTSFTPNLLTVEEVINVNLTDKPHNQNQWIRRVPTLYNMTVTLGSAYHEMMGTKERTRLDIHGCADTGAFRTLIGMDIAHRLKASVSQHESVQIKAANNQEITYAGSCDIKIFFKGKNIFTTALVSPQLDGKLIIGRGDLMEFELVPKKFPSFLCDKCALGTD